jgi:hypothetical protein
MSPDELETRIPTFAAARRLFESTQEGRPDAGSHERPGEVGGYVVESELSSGGGGTVYGAVRPATGRRVAIKIVHAPLGSAPEAERAWRELDLLSRIRLPHVPQLLDYGEHGGRIYFVTDLIDGAPLLDHCERNRLGRAARVELLARVAEAVQDLHGQGVIHRDIKPANILVTAQGRPVIVDLGIASLLARDPAETLTAEGEPLGSPAWMAPEQARGERSKVSTRSDVYGLGATAYSVLTGHPPHAMDSAIHDAIRRVAQDEPRHPRTLDPSMPKPLAAILLKAVARQPESRYASAEAFAADLRRWLNHDIVDAHAPSALARLVRWCGRHPIAATAAACAAIGLLSIGATLASIWHLRMRPYTVEVAQDGRQARLVSVAGAVLRTWESVAGGIAFGELVEDPERGKVALLGFRPNHTDARLRGCVCAYPVQSSAGPAWSARITEGDIDGSLLPPKKYIPEQFHAEAAVIADTFPGLSGPEIVVIHKDGPHSACAVRVYSLDGEVLCQWWHDGALNPGRWVAGPRLLVFTGLNCQAPWEQLGYPGVTGKPIVVFAVRPEPGFKSTAWTAPGVRDSTLCWYRCLLPPGASDSFSGAQVIEPHAYEDPLRYVRIEVQLRADTSAGFSWLVDGNGSIVPDSLVRNDAYRARQESGSAPDPGGFELGDMPSVVDKGGASSPLTEENDR